MKSTSSWSFCLFSKRQVKVKNKPSSIFYCSDSAGLVTKVEHISESVVDENVNLYQENRDIDIDPLPPPMSAPYYRNEPVHMLQLCCGLSTLSQRSVSLDSTHPYNNTAKSTSGGNKLVEECVDDKLSEFSKSSSDCMCNPNITSVKMRNEQNTDKNIVIIPCKKQSFYPQYDGGRHDQKRNLSSQDSEEEEAVPISPSDKSNMVSVREKKELFEALNSPGGSAIRNLQESSREMCHSSEALKSSNISSWDTSPIKPRISFTTDDVEHITSNEPNTVIKISSKPAVPLKKPSYDVRVGKDQQILQNLHNLNSQQNSRSMNDVGYHANSNSSLQQKLVCMKPKITAPPAPILSESSGCLNHNDDTHHHPIQTSNKPQIPPKSPKLYLRVNKLLEDKDTKIESGNEDSKVNNEVDVPLLNNNKYISVFPKSVSVSSLCSDSDFEDSDVDDTGHTALSLEPSYNCATSLTKAQQVAKELLETEKIYVSKLYLIDQIFQKEITDRNKVEKFMPEDIVTQIFSNVNSIYQFHKDHLLPQLTSHLEKIDDNSGVGSVMKRAAPFFKLYTEYVTNYSNANNIVTAWVAKSEKFSSILDELQRYPESGNLALQHHLLEPIQRVPRYKLLLTDYLKHLPEESSEKKQVEDALLLVTDAAQHTNDEIKKMDKFKELLDLCEMLVFDKEESLVTINRELKKEGKITKVSARDGSPLERYLFLFNDILLVCASLPLRIGFSQQYHVKSKLDICGMKILEGDNEDYPNTFVIKSKQKSIEFATNTSDEKLEWMGDLWCVISQYIKKENTKDKEFLIKTYTKEELGKRAPTWVKDQDTSMCMLCSRPFSTFKRRHHCRACGKVVCSECSSHKTKMDYDKEKLNRVCDICYSILESSSTPKIATRHKGPAVLGVKAVNEDAALSGYLNVSLDCKTWNRRWVTLHFSCALYIFKAKRDNAAYESLPLPGYQVEIINKEEDVKTKIFKVFHDKLPKVYFFSTDDRQLFTRWFESLKLAVMAELFQSTSPLIVSPSHQVTQPSLLTNEMPIIDEIDKHELLINSSDLV